MKKLLSLTLAMLMIFSLSAVGFAKTVYITEEGFVDVDTEIPDNASYFQPGVTYKFYLKDGDHYVDDEFMEIYRTTLKLGDVDKYDGETGKGRDYVTTCTLEQDEDGYYYVKFQAKNSSKFMGEINTIHFTLTLREKNLKSSDWKIQSTSDDYYGIEMDDGYVTKIGDVVYPEFVTEVEVEVGYPDEEYITEEEYEVSNDAPVAIADEIGRSTLKFSNVAEYDARFGTTEKKYNLGYSLEENRSIVDNNPDAKMNFISFNATPDFVSNAKFRVYLSGAKYLYEITDDGLVLREDAEQGDGYMEIRTKELTAYVVSDQKLSGNVVANSSSSSSSSSTASSSSAGSVVSPSGPSTKPNPETGRGWGVSHHGRHSRCGEQLRQQSCEGCIAGCRL